MRKRNISIPIRVTEKELSVIDRKAAKARLTRTEYLITCALGKEITLIEDLKPILADLRRVGNNLNTDTPCQHGQNSGRKSRRVPRCLGADLHRHSHTCQKEE